jgi:hypothetical protein
VSACQNGCLLPASPEQASSKSCKQQATNSIMLAGSGSRTPRQHVHRLCVFYAATRVAQPSSKSQLTIKLGIRHCTDNELVALMLSQKLCSRRSNKQ